MRAKSSQPGTMSSRRVNDLYQPGTPGYRLPDVASRCTRSPCPCGDGGNPDGQVETARILDEHNREWDANEALEAHNRHGLMTWSQGGAPGLNIVRGEGVYIFDADGKKYMDFNSMAMCSNHGHTVDSSVVAAIVEQLESLPYAYPGVFHTPIRGRLCKLLADLCPGDLDTFMFPSSGAEAVEGAIRIARRQVMTYA